MRGHRSHTSDRGAVAVVFGVAIVALFGVAALVVDLGNARQVERKVQNAADAGVLAGVQDLPATGTDAEQAAAARLTAGSYALASLRLDLPTTVCQGGASDATCYADGAYVMRVITPVDGNGQRIRIELCEQTETVFARVLDQLSPNVCKSAEAELRRDFAAAPAVLATDPAACGAINTHGNGDVIALGGAIQVNSDCSRALTQEGSSSELISDTCICVVGGSSMEHPANADPGVTEGADPATNPYEDVPVVPVPAGPGSHSGRTYHPGYYGSRISLSSGTYTFMPGIYYLDGGIKVEGVTTITGEGVLFYVAGGNVDIGAGPNTIRLSAYTGENTVDDPDGPYDGLVIYQAPTNTSTFNYGDDTFAGVRSGDACAVTATSGLDGGVYVPNALVHIRGNNARFCATAPIVAETIEVEEWSTLAGVGGSDPAGATVSYALVD